MKRVDFARLAAGAALCASWAMTEPSAVAQSESSRLTPAQTISRSDMTKVELDFYQTLNGQAAEDFIVTRSYLRLAQQEIDHKLPPLKFPARKPDGFSVKYLLPDDPSVINRAIADYLTAKMKLDLSK